MISRVFLDKAVLNLKAPKGTKATMNAMKLSTLIKVISAMLQLPFEPHQIYHDHSARVNRVKILKILSKFEKKPNLYTKHNTFIEPTKEDSFFHNFPYLQGENHPTITCLARILKNNLERYND